MDEMTADITFAVENYHAVSDISGGGSGSQTCPNDSINQQNDIFIYGESEESSVVRISEDQSGAEATISNASTYSQTGSRSIQHDYNNRYCHQHGLIDNHHCGSICTGAEEQRICKEKLLLATMIASKVRERIRSKIRFSTTIGVSISPMLAKLASDLKVSFVSFFSTIIIYIYLQKLI